MKKFLILSLFIFFKSFTYDVAKIRNLIINNTQLNEVIRDIKVPIGGADLRQSQYFEPVRASLAKAIQLALKSQIPDKQLRSTLVNSITDQNQLSDQNSPIDIMTENILLKVDSNSDWKAEFSLQGRVPLVQRGIFSRVMDWIKGKIGQYNLNNKTADINRIIESKDIAHASQTISTILAEILSTSEKDQDARLGKIDDLKNKLRDGILKKDIPNKEYYADLLCNDNDFFSTIINSMDKEGKLVNLKNIVRKFIIKKVIESKFYIKNDDLENLVNKDLPKINNIDIADIDNKNSHYKQIAGTLGDKDDVDLYRVEHNGKDYFVSEPRGLFSGPTDYRFYEINGPYVKPVNGAGLQSIDLHSYKPEVRMRIRQNQNGESFANVNRYNNTDFHTNYNIPLTEARELL